MGAPVPASAQQLAVSYLREQILSGQFPGGMRIKAEKVAETLGLSRMPVREALLQLHAEGLVVARPNRSAVVTRLTPDDVLELFEIRAVLEGLAARLATPRLTQDVLADLRSLRARMDLAADDAQLWLERHEAFHERLCELSERPRLIRQIRTYRAAVLPYLRMYINIYHEVEVQGAEHKILMDIVQRRNGELIEMAMRDHILTAASGPVEFLRGNHPPAPAAVEAAGGRGA